MKYIKSSDPVGELMTDIGQIKEEIAFLNQQIASKMIHQDHLDNEIKQLEQRKEVFLVDLFDLEQDLNDLLSDQSGC